MNASEIVLNRIYCYRAAGTMGFYIIIPRSWDNRDGRFNCEVLFSSSLVQTSVPIRVLGAMGMSLPDPAVLGRKFHEFSQVLTRYAEEVSHG